MKVVVFGGSGFVGSHIADALTQKNFDVTIYDKNPSKYLKNTQKMIIGDILDYEKVESAVQGADYIYNFAGIADLDTAMTKPADTVQLNIIGNNNILEAALKNRIKRFVYASTIYVYSQRGGFYRCSKQSAELYIEEYEHHYGLSYTIIRFGTLYGPRANNNNSIYRYVNEAILSNQIKFEGNGEEIREYIHVKDAAKLSTDILDDKYKNKHIIITGHHPMKANEMFLLMEEILGKKIAIEYTKPTEAHYKISPYSFIPKIGTKLVTNEYIDMGQGLLGIMEEVYNKSNNNS